MIRVTAPAIYIQPIPDACMARGLTEVVFQTSLPGGKLQRLSASETTGRITLTPVSVNGRGYPTRYLVAASGFDRRRQTIMEALQDHFDDVRLLHEDDRTFSVMAELSPSTRSVLDGTLGEALHGFGKDVIFRPALIKCGQLHVSLIVTQETPAEDAIHRIARLFADRGVDSRLVRIEAYHPEYHGLGTYEEALTPKQGEILKMALALGLYDTPRRCTLDDLAGIFGISKAAAHNRMKGAERKILASYFEP